MIVINNVSSGYGTKEVVHQVSFRVQPGEKVCIVGPNGCGKSTLLKAIVGLLPYRGQVQLGGRELTDFGPKERATYMAFLSQMNDAYFSYTVEETVGLGRYAQQKSRIFSSPSREDKEIVTKALSMVGIEHIRHRPITALSGGELQRVFLAKVFAQTPSLIILDEPTNHLDLKYQIELMKHMNRWVSEGRRGVIAVLHDLNLALSFGDRILLLSEGEQVSFNTKGELLHSGALNNVYGLDIKGYMESSLAQWQEG